jgi:signal transduction histidine kinase
VRSFRLRLAAGLAVLDTLLLVAGLWLETREHIHVGPSPHWLAFLEIGVVLAYGPLAVLVASRQPRNPVPWFLLYFATTAGAQVVLGYAAQRMLADGTSGAEWVAWLTSWMVSPAFATLYVLLLQLFPDGRAASPRFARLLPVTVAIIVATTVTQALQRGPVEPYHGFDNPAGVLPEWTALPGLLGLAAVAILTLASLVVRFRAAAGRERLQLQLWLLAALSAIAMFLVAFGVYEVSHYYGDALFNASSSVVVGLPLLAALAIVRHRLYDIDIVLNRALTYGLLTAVIGGAYAALVFGVGALASGSGALIAALAAALCALAFAPLRSWLQRAVDRLLYGARNEPASAVETLGRQLGATADPADLLPTLATVIARTLRLRYVAVELADGGGYTRAAEAGTPTDDVAEQPLVAHGEVVGRLLLAARGPGERLSEADLRVLEMLSAQAGPAVLAVRLGAELARSREQLVSAREEERRRLRRDLHDGLGPTLAAVGMQLAAASALADRPDELRALHAELQEQTRQALADIRRLVYDLRPPALDELGLGSAIEQQGARFTGLEVDVRAEGDLAGLPAAVEVAAYRIAAEAITNAARHGEARTCSVRLALNGALDLEVIDDGTGLAASARAGVGLSSMRERAAELGGTCEIGPAPGGGTRVRARLPVVRPAS